MTAICRHRKAYDTERWGQTVSAVWTSGSIPRPFGFWILTISLPKRTIKPQSLRIGATFSTISILPYERMQSLYADVVSYKNGVFSLFMPSRNVLAEAQKYGTVLYIPFQDESPAERVPVYRYAVGDSVFIHGTEHEIDEMERGTILIRDKSFPIYSYTYEPAEFVTLLRDNPLNDHLISEFVERVPEQEQSAEIEITETDIPVLENVEESEDERGLGKQRADRSFRNAIRFRRRKRKRIRAYS